MPTPLRVLIVEDMPDDSELMLRELRRAGFEPDWQRVETAPDYLARLDPAPDVVLADYSLPQFDALSALRLLRERGLDVPFVVVTGSVGEEAAVECMKQGAADYLLKDRLARLGPAVTQALEQRRLRAEKRRSDAALRESERRFRLLAEHATDMIARSTPDGVYLYASPACRALLGYAPEELVGRSARDLVHPDDRAGPAKTQARLAAPADTCTATYRARRKDGGYVWLETTSRAVRDARTGAVLEVESVSRDVTERKRAEERVRASLKEKEVLLREIHHRVKNNLQVISSLLLLQSRHVQDARARDLFLESRGRVLAMALIHEKLYRSKDLARVDMAEYVRSLAPPLLRSATAHAADIDLRITVDNIFLGVDTAIPCGLLINELVTNSLKHAFPGGRRGLIHVDLRPTQENRFALTVHDSGVGLPAHVDFRRAQSLGLQLVCALADQLGAAVEVSNGAGTTFRITFAELKYRERGIVP
jgi:PAS domain S-box-containing protein